MIVPVPREHDRTAAWADEMAARTRHLEWRQMPPSSFRFGDEPEQDQVGDDDVEQQPVGSEDTTLVADVNQKDGAEAKSGGPKDGGGAGNIS